MNIRYYLDPETGEPHIHGHGVVESEVEDVLAKPLEDRPGTEDSRLATGQSRAGRYLRVIYVPDPVPDSVFVITAYPPTPKATKALATAAKEETTMKATANRFPPGWDEARVRRVIEHYESQTDEEAIAEDEAAYESTTETTMEVPTDLVPKVRALIARRRSSKPRTKPDARRR